MNFYDEYLRYKNLDFEGFLKSVNEEKTLNAIAKDTLNLMDFLTLISEKAADNLEEMARKAHKLTVQHFGKTILMYTPMYLSNYCTNQCIYCGFNKENKFKRKQLTLEEVEEEAKVIAKSGLKHIIILTGDAKQIASVEYICDCVKIIKKYFSSICVEIYSLEEEEYRQLVEAGVDAFTMYQETYNEKLYDEIHIKGPKKDYMYRLDAPERACKAQMVSVNIGALLGLDDWRKEIFFTVLHANYLQNKYPSIEISISLPRLRPHLGSYEPASIVTDKDIVQIMTAFRLFMPRAGITISTRESKEFRNNIIRLGVTKMSAGSCTVVGGHTDENETIGQFDISDERNVEEMKQAIVSLGYQPVLKNWEAI